MEKAELTSLGHPRLSAVPSRHMAIRPTPARRALYHVGPPHPQWSELQAASTTGDYDFAARLRAQFLLPTQAVTKMQSSKLSLKNDIEFRDYGKLDASLTSN